MANETQQDTPIVLRSVGVLFNQQAASHNAQVAGLVEMVTALRSKLEEDKIVPFGAEDGALFEADDETIVATLNDVETSVVEGVQKEVEQMENQDIIGAMNNVKTSFKRAMTLICYMDNIPLPTHMTLVDHISMSALNEFQMQYQQQLNDEAAKKQAEEKEEKEEATETGTDEE